MVQPESKRFAALLKGVTLPGGALLIAIGEREDAVFVGSGRPTSRLVGVAIKPIHSEVRIGGAPTQNAVPLKHLHTISRLCPVKDRVQPALQETNADAPLRRATLWIPWCGMDGVRSLPFTDESSEPLARELVWSDRRAVHARRVAAAQR